jgi:RNA polymerase sigma-70 factor (ECF subfamily)
MHPERRPTLDAKQALDRFLAGVERRAFVTARLATRDGEEALDIVQDAMLAMIRHYAGRPQPEWGPLFHSVLQSRINDWHRRTRVRSRWRVWFARAEDPDEDTLLYLPDGASPFPEMQTAYRSTLAAREAALRRQQRRQQQAFLLRVWEGLDVGETARAMRCAEGSVKTHYSRAVHALRDMLGEHWP